MNKLPWFSHDHDAHRDLFLRESVKEFGHVAYSTWWIILECLHWHGVGDRLVIDEVELARACMTHRKVLHKLLHKFQLAGKISWKQDGLKIDLRCEKFRKRQSKLKSKVPPTFPGVDSNVPLYKEIEKEKEPPISPKGFPEFWAAYPKKTGKGAAEKSWRKIRPSVELTDRIMASLAAHARSRQWQEEGGRFIPNPATWLNQRRWEDEVKEVARPRFTPA